MRAMLAISLGIGYYLNSVNSRADGFNDSLLRKYLTRQRSLMTAYYSL